MSSLKNETCAKGKKIGFFPMVLTRFVQAEYIEQQAAAAQRREESRQKQLDSLCVNASLR
jgi:hypothetical protein